MRRWRVAGAILQDDRGLLLVANRRRNGSIDWTPPGGVIDDGETVLGALSREVTEETGLVVSGWSAPVYEVEVDFRELDMHLRVTVHQAIGWAGDLSIDDPDGIVVDARFIPLGEVDLTKSPLWVAEPVADWLTAPWEAVRGYTYRVTGTDAASYEVLRL
jgi:8-oxo-dGTP diphosphatase